jgi:hypothetical protein
MQTHVRQEKNGREGNTEEIRKANQLKWLRVIATIVEPVSNSSSIASVSLPRHGSHQLTPAHAPHRSPRHDLAAARACGTPLSSFNFSIGGHVCSPFSWVNNQSKSHTGLKLYCITTFNMSLELINLLNKIWAYTHIIFNRIFIFFWGEAKPLLSFIRSTNAIRRRYKPNMSTKIIVDKKKTESSYY